MPWPSDGAVEKASTAGPNNAARIFLPIRDTCRQRDTVHAGRREPRGRDAAGGPACQHAAQNGQKNRKLTGAKKTGRLQ